MRPRTLARARWVGLAAAVLAGLALARRAPWRPEPPAAPAAPLPAEVFDMAVACIGAGETLPAIAVLEDGELDDLLAILARLIAAYERGDFDSFLALRSGDLAFAEREQLGLREELRSFCEALGTPREALPRSWVGLLGTYWKSYYAEPPVARFLPESTRVELHAEGLGTRSLAAWEAEFRERCAALPGARLDHRPMIPHRRSIELVARGAGPLRWLDLELGYLAHDAALGRLLARFVWDGRAEEWFLHRATTVLDGELRDDRRHLVL